MQLSYRAVFSCGYFTFHVESTFTIRFRAVYTKRTNASGSVKWNCRICSHHGSICIMLSSSETAVPFHAVHKITTVKKHYVTFNSSKIT